MSPTIWIVIAVSIFVVLGFVLAMRALLRENREIDKKIDYSKVKPWVDDEDEDDKWGR